MSSPFKSISITICVFFGILCQRVAAQEPIREVRAVWVATVNNIDWPSANYLDPAEQRAEFIILLDKMQAININTIFVQVRTAADAMYPSPYEPWSQYLNGRQGKAPEPFYDPMAFMIREAHRRGMEFHAWVNPFRAIANINTSLVDENHITKRHPEWFINYGHTKIFNPGIPQVRDYILKVLADMVMRYDLDGLHYDDYFYPYPIRGELIADANSYFKYGRKFADRAQWRRNNIDRFVRDTYLMLQQVKPFVKFGISPFPVWRNKGEDVNGSKTSGGLTNYSHLYADVRKWLKEGWIDYVAPQCYQVIDHEKIPFRNITSWWSENTFGRHLYVGHAPYRLLTDSPGWDDNLQILKQLGITQKLEGCQGNAYYNITSLVKNTGGVYNQLEKVYKSKALPPSMPWKGGKTPAAAKSFSVSASPKGLIVAWEIESGSRPYRFVIAREEITTKKLDYVIIPGTLRSFIDPETLNTKSYKYYIASSSRLWDLSSWIPAVRDVEIQGY